MQAPPSQDEINLYNEYWNTLSGNSNAQVLPEHIIVNFYKASNLNNQVNLILLLYFYPFFFFFYKFFFK